jgi:hypothetical protein
VIDQEAPHDLSRQRHEVSPGTGFRRTLCENLNVDLVDQGRGLQGVIGAFPAQMVSSHAAKVGIQQIEETALGGSVAFLDTLQKFRYFSWSCYHIVSETIPIRRDLDNGPEF